MSGPLFTVGRARWRSPVWRHRAPGAGRPPRVAAAALLFVLVAFVGGAVAGGRLSEEERYGPFQFRGGPAEPVSVDSFTLTVTGVRVAEQIVDQLGSSRDTGGVWLVVTVRVVAHETEVSLALAEVRDRQGRQWWASERVQQPLVEQSYRLQPGVPVEGEIVFEVPVGASADLTLRLGERPIEMMAVAEVRLPAATASGAAGDPAPGELVLQPPRVAW